MSTRIIIYIVFVAGMTGAWAMNSVAAAYVTVFGTWVMVTVHAIEYKLNKLLDYYNIVVTSNEVAGD